MLATQRQRALHCDEAWLRSGVGCHVAAYQKAKLDKNFLFPMQRRRDLCSNVPESMGQVFFFLFFLTRIWPSHTVMNM